MNFDALNNVKMSAAIISDEDNSWDEALWDSDEVEWFTDEEDDEEDLDYGNVPPVDNDMPDSINVRLISYDIDDTGYCAVADDMFVWHDGIILSKCAAIMMMLHFEEPAIMVNIALLLYELHLNTRWDWAKLSENPIITFPTTNDNNVAWAKMKYQ